MKTMKETKEKGEIYDESKPLSLIMIYNNRIKIIPLEWLI